MGNVLELQDWVGPMSKSLTDLGVEPARAEGAVQAKMRSMFARCTGGGTSVSLSKAIATTGIIPNGDTSGGDALKFEDVVAQVQVTELESKNYCPFWNTITKKPTKTDVVQLTELNSFGGSDDNAFLDDSLSDGGMSYQDPNIERDTTPVKWLGGMGQVMRSALAVEAMGIDSDPAVGNAGEIASWARLEALLKGLNRACWHADNGRNSMEFNGFLAQVRRVHKRGSDNKITRINMNGLPITPKDLAAAEYVFYDNGGMFNELWYGGALLSDTKNLLQDAGAARWGSGDKITMGQIADSYVIQAMNLDVETIKIKRDHHLDPWKGNGTHQPTNLLATSYKPTAVAAVNSNVNAKNIWDSYLPQNTYYYAVDGKGSKGNSEVQAGAAPVVVGLNEKAILSITQNSSETKEYRIWRGTSPTNLKLLTSVKAAPGGGVTTFVDNGEFVPGCGMAVASSNHKVGQGFSTVMFRQLWPLDKIALPTAAMSEQFAWITAGTMQLLKPVHNIIFENVGRMN